MAKKFGGNKKRLFLMIFGMAILVLGFWAGGALKAEAETTGKFVRIKIDGDGGLSDKKDLWNVFLTDNGEFDDFSIPNTITSYNSDDHVCGLLLTDEDGFAADKDDIIWTKKGAILGKNTDIKDDVDDVGYKSCTNEGQCNAGWSSCSVLDGTCDIAVINDANKVFQKNYGSTMEINECTINENGNAPCTGTAALCCALLPNSTGLIYDLYQEIICGNNASGNNKWHLCNDESACVSEGINNYACNSGVWTKCTATETCTGGACVAAANTLILSGSASPTSIVKSTGTSTITFKVIDGTNPVAGAVVNSITATGGTLIPAAPATCTTGADGTCTVIYNAGAVAGNFTVSATKATKAIYTDSGGVTVNIKIINTPCVPANCSAAVASACDCNAGSAAAGQYCCESASAAPYVFAGQAACQVACAICTAAQASEITGGIPGPNCNFADAPCERINGLAPGVNIRTQNTSLQVDLFDPNGYYQSWPAGTSGSFTRGNDVDSCVPGIWKIKLKGTICSASAVSGGVCPVCDSGVDCNGNQYCVGGVWVNCPGGQTCVGGICVPAGPGACNQLACGGAVSNQPCMCGLQLVSANGDYCCAVNNFYGTLANCQASDPSCAAAACVADGGACPGGNGDCCSNNCVGGTCAAAAVPPVCDPTAWFFCNPLKGTVDNIVQAGETLLGYILGLIGSIALLVIIIAGVIYMTSAGSEEKITTSKRILTGAVIGLIIALLAYSLLQVIILIL